VATADALSPHADELAENLIPAPPSPQDMLKVLRVSLPEPLGPVLGVGERQNSSPATVTQNSIAELAGRSDQVRVTEGLQPLEGAHSNNRGSWDANHLHLPLVTTTWTVSMPPQLPPLEVPEPPPPMQPSQPPV